MPGRRDTTAQAVQQSLHSPTANPVVLAQAQGLDDVDDEDPSGASSTARTDNEYQSPTATLGIASVGCLGALRDCWTRFCVDHQAIELARVKCELAERERQIELQSWERERKRAARENAQLAQALQASEERMRADRVELERLLQASEDRAQAAELMLAGVQAELSAVYRERQLALEADERLKAENKRREADARRDQELEALREQMRHMKDEQQRLAEVRRLAEIEAIKEAQQEARLGRASVAMTPATDVQQRTYALIGQVRDDPVVPAPGSCEDTEDIEKAESKESIPASSLTTENAKPRFVPPPPRRPSQFVGSSPK